MNDKLISIWRDCVIACVKKLYWQCQNRVKPRKALLG